MIFKKLRIKLLKRSLDGLNFQFKNLSWYLLATVLASFTGVFINPFLAANLSPEDYAIIGYFTSFNSLILYIISFSFLSYYSRNYYRILENDRQSVLDTLLVSQLLLGTFAFLFVLLGFHLFMNIAKVDFPFFPFALLSFIPVLFSCFYNFLLVEKRMQRQAYSFFKISLAHTVSSALFAILFVVILKKGALGRFWSILIPMVGMGVFGFIKLVSKFQFDRKVFKDAVSFGWPISLSAILYYFLSGVDRAMLEQLGETGTFGIYNVAVQIVAYLSVFYTAISQTFEPDIYKSIADNNRKGLFRIVAGIILLNAIPTLLFILLAEPIVNILTYGRYTDSTVFAQIMAIKNIPMAFCFLFSNIIIGYGYPKVELVNRSIGAFLSVILFSSLIKRFGFIGAAWGHTFSYILMTAISSIFIIYKILHAKRDNIAELK